MSKVKISVKKKPKSVSIDGLVELYDKKTTFDRALRIANLTNKELGLPTGSLYPEEYDKDPKAAARAICSYYTIRNHSDLKTYLGALAGLLIKIEGYSKGNFYYFFRNVMDEYPLDTVTESKREVPLWEDLRKQLIELRDDPKSSNVVSIIATLYADGYLMRPQTLFDTCLGPDDEYNSLDMETGRFNLQKQKNGKEFGFVVEPETLAILRKKVSGKWLLSKSNGDRYSHGAVSLSYWKWPLVKSQIMRQSFEDWNVNRSGHSLEEQQWFHDILGHARATAVGNYSNRPTSTNQRPRIDSESSGEK